MLKKILLAAAVILIASSLVLAYEMNPFDQGQIEKMNSGKKDKKNDNNGNAGGGGNIKFEAMDYYGSPPGIQNGYRLWKTQDGEWHLRMKSSDKKIVFSGVITCLGQGRIKSAWAIKMESRSDHGGWNDREIQFRFKADEGRDGIDWVGNCEGFRFDMDMNGDHRPNHVHVGGKDKSPDYLPFNLPNN